MGNSGGPSEFQQNDNVQSRARWAVVIGSGALALYGLSRRSKRGAALAAASGLLAYKSASRPMPGDRHSAQASFAINCSPEQAYRYWRNFENLPRFMRHIESVRVTGDNRTEWIGLGPMDKEIRWTAETTVDRPNERIAWRSLPGSDVENSGSVEFRSRSGGRGTDVTVKMNYVPLAGPLGRAVAMVFGKDPEFTVREDLRHFKSLIETGEVATILGQTHGPRGLHGRVEQALFREKQHVAPQGQPAMRRTA